MLRIEHKLYISAAGSRRRRRRFRIDTEVRCVGAHPPFGPFSRWGLNPIKPVHDPDRPDGRFNLRASAFNQLGQYTAVLLTGATAMQNSLFSSLAVAVTIASTHCVYPQRICWVGLGGWLHSEIVYLPEGSYQSQY